MKNSVLDTSCSPVHSVITIYPGEVLKEEMEVRNLQKKEAALAVNLLPGHLNGLFKGKRHINAQHSP